MSEEYPFELTKPGTCPKCGAGYPTFYMSRLLYNTTICDSCGWSSLDSQCGYE